MALYPKARYRPVSGLSLDPPIIPIGVILHVRAGTGDSLFGYFNGPSGGIESHMYLTFDGHWEQYRDTTREADAQGEGNSFVIDGKRYGFISVETEGGPNGTWTATQLTEMKTFLTWAHETHDIPLVVAPAWNKPGVGYHCLFNQWNHNAHICPGPARIKQFNTVIVPWMGEDDLPTPDEIAHAVWAYDQQGKKRQAWAYLQSAAADQAPRIAAAVKAELPPTGAATLDQLEQAFRKVLGSLDEQ